MASSDILDWNMDSIVERDVRVSDEILKILTQWDNSYNNDTATLSGESPSEEQQAMIEEFKKKGWVQ